MLEEEELLKPCHVISLPEESIFVFFRIRQIQPKIPLIK
jgi:hypothetical protein